MSSLPIILKLPRRENDRQIGELQAYDPETHTDFEVLDQNKTKVEDSNAHRSLHPMFSRSVSIYHPDTWPERTDVSCWWCCHAFDTEPVPLPVSVSKGRFSVMGCFCSYNCSLSYSYSMRDQWGSRRERLLRRYYEQRKRCAPATADFTPAPPREVLKKFGGMVSIDQYRKGMQMNDIMYRVNTPPVLVIIPKIEVIHGAQIDSIERAKRMRENRSYIPLNMERVGRALTNLSSNQEKRAPNSLEVTMGIQVE